MKISTKSWNKDTILELPSKICNSSSKLFKNNSNNSTNNILLPSGWSKIITKTKY